jgi:UDP-N-acetylmuramate dehydrogenase
MEVDVGMSLGKLVELSIQNKLSGLEWAAGIPGTLGGAIRGNAGAHYLFVGGEIKDNLEKVEVWRDGEVLEIFNSECAFEYRDSIFKNNSDVILRAWFKLQPGDQKTSLLIAQKVLQERQGKHPSEPSAGSFFKNIPLEKWTFDKTILPSRFLGYKKVAAGWVIEQCGLRGFKVGGAMIAERHGNFLINADHATQEDVLKIVEEVKERVYNRFGVDLEPEVQIVQ